jgi:hypothetical protein
MAAIRHDDGTQESQMEMSGILQGKRAYITGLVLPIDGGLTMV